MGSCIKPQSHQPSNNPADVSLNSDQKNVLRANVMREKVISAPLLSLEINPLYRKRKSSE